MSPNPLSALGPLSAPPGMPSNPLFMGDFMDMLTDIDQVSVAEPEDDIMTDGDIFHGHGYGPEEELRPAYVEQVAGLIVDGKVDRAAFSDNAGQLSDEVVKRLKEKQSFDCDICLADECPETTLILDCGHGFCEGCVLSWVKEVRGRATCPSCRASLTLGKLTSLALFRKVHGDKQS